MKIRAELYTSKPNKEGHFPIKILFQGKKQNRISTGIYCKKKSHFDIKNGRFVSRNGDPDYKQHNHKIEELLLKYQSRKKELEDAGKEPTFELLTTESPILNPKAEVLNFIDVVQEYADNCKNNDGKIVYNTQRLYLYLKKFLITHYGEYININEINSKLGFQGFIALLNKHKSEKNVTRNRMITQFLTVLKYAQDNDYIDCVTVGKITRYPEKRNIEKLNLEKKFYTKLISKYKKTVLLKHPKYDKFTSGEIALYLWNFHLALQGISDVDLFKLRIKDLEEKTIFRVEKDEEKYQNDENYRKKIDHPSNRREIMEINLSRKKVTGSYYKIIVDRETIEPFLELFYYGKEKEEFLVHNKLDYRAKYDDETFIRARTSFYNKKQEQLNKYWQTCFTDEELKELNIVEAPHLTYAQSRHAFVDILEKLDLERHIISKFIGHTRMSLDSYIDPRVPVWEHSEISRLIFNNIMSIKDLMKERNDHLEEYPEKKNTIYTRQDYGKNFYMTREEYCKKNKEKRN